ncbi:MAG: inositol monophosphatase family protein [bacterium]|nr:inositol monophosphatase family protein [bacterium]MDD3624138.1 inositol monophosphatase family protein [Proteiniphilum sp.]MDD3968237.1 inositol monophosphatase family protein [Proteiniphilum sp.]MDD4458196.1 inositol monophosphatase family protein [Proteiniphilum sp.]
MDRKRIAEEVIELARATGAYLKSEQQSLQQKEIELKGTRNYVTYIDKEAEKKLVESLRLLLPQAAFLTEEKTVRFEPREYTWIIDPLDGTTNYVHGDTPYSVSIALMQQSQVILGVVFDPVADQLFVATGEGEAYLNGAPLRVSRQESLTNGYIGFGIPYTLDSREEAILVNAMKQFRSCSFRIKGSAAIEICYVAAGITDGYFHSGLSAWDVAAGSYILTCAGGRCSDFSGGGNYLFGREMVATNGRVHEAILQTIITVD